MKMEKGTILRTEQFTQTVGFRLMLIELIINVIHCPPRVDITFLVDNMEKKILLSLDGIFMCFMLLRVYLISKLFAHYSKWLSPSAQERAEQENCEATVIFAIKAVLKEKPNQTMIFLMVISDITFAFAVRHFELAFYKDVPRDADSDYQDYDQVVNAMWLIMITMMTVGFGDYFPKTHLGRMICIVACFWGVFIVSMMVVTLTNATTLSKKENRAYSILNRLNVKDDIRRTAGKVLEKLFFLHRLQLNYKKQMIGEKDFKKARVRLQNELQGAVKEFRSQRNNLVQNELTDDELLRQITEQMDRDLNDIRKSMLEICEIRERLQEIECSQDIVLTTISEVVKLSKFLDEVLMKYRFK